MTEAVRRKPYSVILLDEIEKAHHDVFNILLQILDEGRLTDSHGRTVNFKNTIVIMTSNICSPLLLEGIDDQGHIAEGTRRKVMEELRAQFRPEFLNRVDETVLFKPLTLAEITRIVALLLAELSCRLESQGLMLEVTEEAERFIAEQGFDPVYGARPLKRFIQREVETPISRKIIGGETEEGRPLQVHIENGALVV